MSESLTPQEILALKREIFSSLHCALPGTVESFDAETQTATVRPALKQQGLAFPLIRDVPVFFPGSRGSGITWPVAEGDECLLLFADADIDRWFETGLTDDTDSGRQHSFSDAFAFVGFRSRENVLPDFPDTPQFFDGAVLPHTHDDRYYTESEMDMLLSGKKDTQSAVTDPAASGTSATFIATLSQDAQGVITPTKKTVQSASSSQNGLMSSGDKAKLDGMAMVSYGTCATGAGTAAKVVTLSNTNWQLKVGSIVGVKFSYTNSFSATADSHVTLNVNSTGAKNILYNTSLPTGTATWAFGTANRVLYYMYDGTNWVWLSWSIDANDNTVPSAYCSTAAATAAKVASCSGYVLLSKSYIQVILTQTNSAASALTLNINSKGAKPVYINGSASSSTNYTLQAGSYLVYYDGTNYQFRTDGQIPGPARSVALGGTGQTGTGGTSTIADIATAATDCEITAASYAYWGKVAMVRLVVKKTTAVSSGTTTLCTLVSGKRPRYAAMAQWAWNNGAIINTSGAVQVSGAISAGASVTIYSTYILA